MRKRKASIPAPVWPAADAPALPAPSGPAALAPPPPPPPPPVVPTTILRVTPKVAPIRFVGLLFTTREPFDFSIRELTVVQRVQLAGHTDFKVEASRDAGRTWHRYQPTERERAEASQS